MLRLSRKLGEHHLVDYGEGQEYHDLLKTQSLRET